MKYFIQQTGMMIIDPKCFLLQIRRSIYNFISSHNLKSNYSGSYQVKMKVKVKLSLCFLSTTSWKCTRGVE